MITRASDFVNFGVYSIICDCYIREYYKQCTKSVTTLMEILQQLGMPVAWDKLEGPAPRLTFLGFELDSINWEIRLPRGKLKELQDLVERWSGRC